MEVKNQSDALQQIKQIRSIIDKSSRFISLSGLSGVFAGTVAIGGGLLGKYLLKNHFGNSYNDFLNFLPSQLESNIVLQIILLMLSVLVVALIGGILLTTRKAKKQNLPIWDRMTYRLLINLCVPIIAGAIVCAILVFKYSIFGLVAPLGLIFYGMGLINGGKYTLDEIKYLGLCEIALGIANLFFIGSGIDFWIAGFGVLHIVYGVYMWFKYERN